MIRAEATLTGYNKRRTASYSYQSHFTTGGVYHRTQDDIFSKSTSLLKEIRLENG